jgi:hypothetical protein
MDKIIFENIFRSKEVTLNDKGMAVCPYCRGTGLNAELNLFNKINEQMHPTVTACCVKCYGKGQTDWVEIANGRIDDKMEYLFSNNRQFLVDDLWYLLTYVYAGYVVPGKNLIQTRYDEDKDQWVESTGIEFPGHEISKREVIHWISKFIEHSYIKDPECIFSTLPKIYKVAPDYEYVANVKRIILDSTSAKIEDLIRVKNDIGDLGYTIEDLNDIEIINEFGKKIEIEFKFTWENLLDRFKLPRNHKYSPLSEGVLTFD